MRKWLVGVIAAAVTGGLAAGFALASGTGGVTVKAMDGEKVAINRYVQDDMRFVPGTVTVKSGSTLTFTYGDKEQEAHTLTIVPKAKLPRTPAQIDQCSACQRYATPHLKNPKAPPEQNNPIVHWTLNKGKPGLDTVGDSIAIQPGAHKSNTAVVSAAPGTTLYFVCAVHAWMQGKIVVTS